MRTIAGVLFILAATAQAQQTPADRSIRDHLTTRAKELEKDFLPEVKSGADFEKLRPTLHQQYLDMLGLWPLPEKTPLKPVVTGTLEEPGVRIEKLHFQSRPGLYVTVNLYLPNPANKGPYPAVLYSCGHYNGGRNGNKSACSEHGLWFASHGYVCLIYDTVELGEVNTTHHGTYNKQLWWWHSTGFTPAGAEAWNAIRAIDYLQSRPEVDPNRIGATGISGGGAATFWISAADDRIKISAPVSGMSDLTWYVGEDGVNGHCDCMFLYNNYRWNWTTIAALVAPRPLLFVNSDNDTIFPMPANDRIINRLKRLYSKFGESDKVDSVVSVGGHAYRSDLRRQIQEFFNRNFKGDPRRVEDPDMGLTPEGKNRINPVSLRVFPEDKDIPADSVNRTIDEVFSPKRSAALPKAEEFEGWRNNLLDGLQRIGIRRGDGRSLTCLTPVTFPADAEVWTVVLDAHDPASDRVPSWASSIVEGKTVCVVQPSTGWTRKNPPNTVERSMALLGMTADSMRVSELMAAPSNGHFVGQGEAGVLAAYAALLRPSIKSVTIVDPPASHRTGPLFLGVLKICDIPDALGALAPRPLTLINAKDPAFDRTAELYRLAGAPDKFTRK